MIDLHLHFDGSLLPRTILELAKEQQLVLPTEDPDELKLLLAAPENCESLNEYLEKFDLPLSVLQTGEAIRKGMYTLICSLKEQGLLYAEVRFAPQSHLRKGMTQEEVVKAAILGMQEALVGTFFKAKLILCCMRGEDNWKANRKTIEVAAAYLGRGVAAIDLAGAEALFPTADFEDLFVYAKKWGVPFVIHAGEADGPESIEAALRFGAARIGHGVRANEDETVLKLLKETQVPLEMCPTSNIQTKAVGSFLEHPILEYLHLGLKVTVNTDNMTVSDTTIEREYQRLETELGMTKEDKKLLLFHAVDAAFLTAEERGRMKDVIGRVV